MTPRSRPLDALLGYVSNSARDTWREILEHTLQALIEVEAAGVVGRSPTGAARAGWAAATGIVSGPGTPGWGGWSWGSPSSARGASCPACRSTGGAAAGGGSS
jgi:hypothetical protein